MRGMFREFFGAVNQRIAEVDSKLGGELIVRDLNEPQRKLVDEIVQNLGVSKAKAVEFVRAKASKTATVKSPPADRAPGASPSRGGGATAPAAPRIRMSRFDADTLRMAGVDGKDVEAMMAEVAQEMATAGGRSA
jgi:hypothetical protein